MDKKINKNDILKLATEYFKGDGLAGDVWLSKYALRDDNNIYERTPADMHNRLASEFARIEAKYKNPIDKDVIYDLMKDFKYIIPAGSPMSGIGNDNQVVSISNCFVIGNAGESDSYGGIMKIDEEEVQLMKRRGGVGTDLSHIRPKGSPVKNSALTSTGIVPFMERYSNTTKEVAQGGRRGALMLSCSVKSIDIEDFIDAKLEQGKITGANISVKITDEFMKSVNSESGLFLHTYPIDLNMTLSDIDDGYEINKMYSGKLNGTYYKVSNAKKIWEKIIKNAWQSAEPGVLFWDTIINESVPDVYSEYGFKTTSTNPCLVGDTLVAVADGRGDVSIRQLAEEGKDVPVYCLDNDNNVVIRIMRNPRITGYGEQIYKVTLDSGDVIRCTGNHKLRLKDKTYKEVKDLKYGDSLQIMTIEELGLHDIYKGSNSRSANYRWIRNGKKINAEHRVIYEFENNIIIPEKHVIHHKDFNALNNKPDNLRLMSKKDHYELHGESIKGKNNPYHKFEHVRQALSSTESQPMETNGNYSGYTNEDIRNAALELVKKYGRRFSKKEYQEYAKEKGMPLTFTKWRKDHLNGGIAGLSKWASIELGYDNISDLDPRIQRRYLELLKDGYDCFIEGNKILFNKTCEICGSSYVTDRRESGLCSVACGHKRAWQSEEGNKKRAAGREKFEATRRELLTEQQLKIYSDLKFKIKRDPLMKEWKEECKINNVKCGIGRGSSNIESWEDLKKSAELYNHKVVTVELLEKEDVYNGTVDEYHNFFIGGFESLNFANKHKSLYINNLQCGEIPLCPYDSCRLLSLNLYSYVKNPFTPQAEFDFELFRKHAKIGQKLMDDLVDLEIEKIDTILAKIESDPEPDNIKRTERELWENIRKMGLVGRRTGLGITAEGDMIAAMNMTYASDEAIAFAEKVHEELAVAAYDSSVDMAIDRGKFEIYDSEKEVDSQFIQRIKNTHPELYSRMIEHGRRNISLLTIAPAGSVSICTQTTSGIEPVFKVAYKRRKKINHNNESKGIFVDSEGQAWDEYNILHHKFAIWAEINGYDINEIVNSYTEEQMDMLIAKSPYYKSTANDIDWVQKVKLQGAIQKWVDHSISVTVNIPKETSVEVVDAIYRTAWSSGCKGMTIYRDGSRDGVLVSNTENVNKVTQSAFIETNAPKRPKKLEAGVIRFQNEKEKWIAIIGILEGRPYEIFTGKADSFIMPANIEKGWIIKVKSENERARYDFQFTDPDGYYITIEGLSRTFEKEYWNYTKLISGVLRHGMSLPNVINLISSLTFDNDTITTWKNGVIRALKKYIKDETHASGERCEKCGAETVIYTDGCKSCTSCGNSKCGS